MSRTDAPDAGVARRRPRTAERCSHVALGVLILSVLWTASLWNSSWEYLLAFPLGSSVAGALSLLGAGLALRRILAGDRVHGKRALVLNLLTLLPGAVSWILVLGWSWPFAL